MIKQIVFVSALALIIFCSGCKKEEEKKQGSLTVLSPNAQDTLEQGSPCTIRWIATECSTVFIQVFKDDVFLEVITRATDNDGSFNWLVPKTTSYPVSSKYKIKISNLDDATVSDFSDNYFYVKSSTTPISLPSIHVDMPNGGEVWAGAGPHTIRWTRSQVSLVKVYLLYQGQIYGEISGNGISSDYFHAYLNGEFYIGSGYKIRVCDAANQSIYDDSDGEFSITQ